jgi:hypothetical protein
MTSMKLPLTTEKLNFENHWWIQSQNSNTKLIIMQSEVHKSPVTVQNFAQVITEYMVKWNSVTKYNVIKGTKYTVVNNECFWTGSIHIMFSMSELPWWSCLLTICQWTAKYGHLCQHTLLPDKHNSWKEMDSTVPNNPYNSCITNQLLPWKPISRTIFIECLCSITGNHLTGHLSFRNTWMWLNTWIPYRTCLYFWHTTVLCKHS